jgi:uncharacterized protein YndB with AHSA1/START domain
MGAMEQKILNATWKMTLLPAQQVSDVVLSYRIAADPARVLYALSMPEYIEAWLTAPDPEISRFDFHPEARNAFRLDLYRGEELQSTVISSCSIVSANQVRYHWKTISPAGLAETLVEMHLRPNPGGCILGLKHSGFKDAAESAWFDRMWRQSLDRLCGLISKSHSVASH